jgi:Fe-S cluster biogenesis protein NfuA
MLRDRIRNGVRRVGQGLARRVLGGSSEGSGHVTAPVGPPPMRAPQAASAPVAARPVASPVAPVPAEVPEASKHDVTGRPMTMATVEAVIADLIRPALQADGGDIDLVRVEDDDVHVRLVGACRTCPSSTITMKLGIERLLAEEFPQFRNLIQVDAMPGAPLAESV